MSSEIQPRLRIVTKAISQAASAFAMTIGATVLAGWALDIGFLKTVSPKWASMKADTAACFILAGLAIWFLRDERPSPPRRFFAQACATAFALVGLLTIIEYFLHTDLGIDQLLFKDPASVVAPGRMALISAMNFLILGLALLALDWKTRLRHHPAQLLTLFVAVISLLALIGYVYGAKSLYSSPPFSTMAVHTAALFFATSVGVLCSRPRRWPVNVLTGEHLGSVMIRRVLPVAIGLSLAAGWLCLVGQQAGFYGLEFGLALFAICNVVIFTVPTCLAAISLDRADATRKHAEHEINKLNVELEERITERTAELEAASRARDRFLASMSHELRTPLNAIIGFTGTLLMELPGPLTSKQKNQLETIKVSAKHHLSLINDLLDLVKIDSGKIELHLEPVACSEIIAEVAHTLRPLAEQKGLSFEVNLPEEVALRTDRRVLSQILTNLVSNAIKFTETGEIRIEMEQNGGLMKISVADTGVGIKYEDQAKLFDPFAHLESGSEHRQEGTGLGLHLGQKLAALLAGRIDFKSKHGGGSTFILTIPAQPASQLPT